MVLIGIILWIYLIVGFFLALEKHSLDLFFFKGSFFLLLAILVQIAILAIFWLPWWLIEQKICPLFVGASEEALFRFFQR